MAEKWTEWKQGLMHEAGEIRQFKQILKTLDNSFLCVELHASCQRQARHCQGRLDDFNQAIYPPNNVLSLLSITLILRFLIRLSSNIFSSIELFLATKTKGILLSCHVFQTAVYHYFICYIWHLFFKKAISWLEQRWERDAFWKSQRP